MLEEDDSEAFLENHVENPEVGQSHVEHRLHGPIFVIPGLEVNPDQDASELMSRMENDPDLQLTGDMDLVQEVVEIQNTSDSEDDEPYSDLADVYGGPVPESDPLTIMTRLEKYDRIIESVVRGTASGLAEIESKQKLHLEKLNKNKRRSNLKTVELVSSSTNLPFQYSGQSFNVQSQKLILNVLHFLKANKRDHIIESVKTPQEKAARVLNISASVIGKIRKNLKMGKLEQPGKTRQIGKRILDKVSTEDEENIRRIVLELTEQNITPTIPVLLDLARRRIKFQGSRTSFRRILARMGCRYMKLDKKVIMVDSRVRPDHRQRTKFSKKLSSPAPQIFDIFSSSSHQEREEEIEFQDDPNDSHEIHFGHDEQQSESGFQEMEVLDSSGARIQFLQGINEESAAEIELGDESQILFQVEGQEYCFQLLPSSSQEEEEEES